MVLELEFHGKIEIFPRNSSSTKNFLDFKFYKKISGKFEGYFFKELQFLEFELQGKLEFHTRVLKRW